MALTPPPSAVDETPRRRRVRPGMWIIIAICVFGCTCPLFVGALFFPVFAQAREAAKAQVCLEHLQLVGDAMETYEAKHGVFPKDIASALQEARSTDPTVLSCTKAETGPGIGYAYNASYFAGRSPSQLGPDFRTVPMLIEVESDQPDATLNESSRFARRHLKGRWINAFFLPFGAVRLRVPDSELSMPIKQVHDLFRYAVGRGA